MTSIKYSDINFSFSKNNLSNDVNIRTNENAIKQSIKNILLTRKGDRPFRDNIGANIHNVLFENFNISNTVSLYSTIRNQIHSFEPRVTIDDIIFDDSLKDSLIDSNILSLEIIFSYVTGTNREPIQDRLTVGIERVR